MGSVTTSFKTHTLSLSFLLIIALFLSFGAFTIRGMFTLGNFTKMIYEHPLVVSNASLTAALNITKMHRSMKDVVLAGTVEEIENTLMKVAQDQGKVFGQLNIIREQILGSEGQALERHTRQLFVNWQPIRQEVKTLLDAGQKNEAILLTRTRGADHVQRLETKMLELTSYARGKANTFISSAELRQSRLEEFTLYLTLAGVLLSIAIAFIAISHTVKAEKQLQREKDKLQQALDEIKTLQGILPICSFCKQIRDDAGIWKQMEEYIHAHSEAEFSHGVCPDCIKIHYSDFCDAPSPKPETRID